MDVPKCPECGSEMRIRVAKKGRNRGNKFFGCSRFPSCRGTVDYSNGDKESRQDQSQDGSFQQFRKEDFIEIPKMLISREKFENYQVRYYECMAVSDEILELINFATNSKRSYNKFCQWRLDYPIQQNHVDINFNQIFLIAFKILTRGHITRISPFVQKRLLKLFGVKEENSNMFNPDHYLNTNKYKKDSGILFDGLGTEKIFYEEYLSGLLGKHFKKFVLPQVNLSSLIDTSQIDKSLGNQRVDFLINVKDEKIIVELDGPEHENHVSKDFERDKLLIENGFTVIRIKNEEVQNGSGDNLHILENKLKNLIPDDNDQLSDYDKFILSLKLSHQLQIVILESLISGFVTSNEEYKIYLDNTSVIFSNNEYQAIADVLLDDLKMLVENLTNLYDVNCSINDLEIIVKDSFDSTSGITITFDDNLKVNNQKFVIQDIAFPFVIALYDRPMDQADIKEPDQNILEYFLYYIFGHTSFKEGQFEAISRALIKKDSIVLLPTGAGKSVAFQLAAMLLPGVTIVIDPIISLIDDQIDNLQRIGIDRCVGITSQITDPSIRNRLIEIFGQGEYIFCYIAPERFQTEKFRSTLKSLTVSTPISLIAIDEAHCVSEWGHDFRTSYLNIGRISREYCKYKSIIPPLLALTGTASSSVLKDVQRELEIDEFDAIITPKTFDRPELKFDIFASSSVEKSELLRGLLLRNLPDKFGLSHTTFFNLNNKMTQSGLIFCPWVNGDHGVVSNAEYLSDQIGINVKFYSGKMPKIYNNEILWNKEKKKTAKEFKNNQIPLMSATKAFGMGIDKPNIRYTIHYGLPGSIESFYQEAGRAGRDGEHSECVLLVSNEDKERSENLLNPNSTIDEVENIFKQEHSFETDDDIMRTMFFHINSFRGIKRELTDIDTVLQKLDNISEKSKINISFQKKERSQIEKAIHRLLILGVVKDYTIDYASNEFSVLLSGINKEKVIDNYSIYVNGYNKGRVFTEKNKLLAHKDLPLDSFVRKCAEILIGFVYDTIEKGRRRALREILALSEEALKNANPDEIIRNRILRYLEMTYSEEIEKILEDANEFSNLIKLVDGYVEIQSGEVIGGIRSPKDASEIRGQVIRYLESYPDHPGLLLLRAISELFCRGYDKIIIKQNIMACINSGINQYNIDKVIVYKIIAWTFVKIYNRDNFMYSELIEELLYELNDIDLVKSLIAFEETIDDMLNEASIFLLANKSKQAVEIFQ